MYAVLQPSERGFSRTRSQGAMKTACQLGNNHTLYQRWKGLKGSVSQISSQLP